MLARIVHCTMRSMTREGAEGLGGRRVWFVTGASRGFGLEIVRQVLEHGDAVVATARDPRRMEEGLAGGGAPLLAMPLDVTDETRSARCSTPTSRAANGHARRAAGDA